jgi:hypothetical protein
MAEPLDKRAMSFPPYENEKVNITCIFIQLLSVWKRGFFGKILGFFETNMKKTYFETIMFQCSPYIVLGATFL